MNFILDITIYKASDDILELMTSITKQLDKKGYVLRSAPIAAPDQAFAKGSTNKEEYLPWKGFAKNLSKLYNTEPEAFTIAKKIVGH